MNFFWRQPLLVISSPFWWACLYLFYQHQKSKIDNNCVKILAAILAFRVWNGPSKDGRCTWTRKSNIWWEDDCEEGHRRSQHPPHLGVCQLLCRLLCSEPLSDDRPHPSKGKGLSIWRWQCQRYVQLIIKFCDTN